VVAVPAERRLLHRRGRQSGPRRLGTTPLIEHWNGMHWTIQHLQMPAGGGEFTGVAALSSRNAWAVGWTGD